MSTRRLAAVLAVLGLVACGAESDATSSVPYPALSNPLGATPVEAVSEPRRAARTKEEGGQRTN
jgi:hypothetical protein